MKQFILKTECICCNSIECGHAISFDKTISDMWILEWYIFFNCSSTISGSIFSQWFRSKMKLIFVALGCQHSSWLCSVVIICTIDFRSTFNTKSNLFRIMVHLNLRLSNNTLLVLNSFILHELFTYFIILKKKIIIARAFLRNDQPKCKIKIILFHLSHSIAHGNVCKHSTTCASCSMKIFVYSFIFQSSMIDLESTY